MAVAPMRFATKRCNSGCTVRSLVATMCQLGFDLQAVPSNFWVNKSAAGERGSPTRASAPLQADLPAEHATPFDVQAYDQPLLLPLVRMSTS